MPETDIQQNGDSSNGSLNIVTLGNGPVGLFLSASLAYRPKNRVVNLGREDSSTIEGLITKGHVELNTKTIRDLYDMLDGQYLATDEDPDLSKDHPENPDERVIRADNDLILKLKRMGVYGVIPAQAINRKRDDYITRAQLDKFRKDHFRTLLKRFDPGPAGDFDHAAFAAKGGFEVSNSPSDLDGFADIVVTTVKAYQINAQLAEQIARIAKPGALIVIAANGVNPTLLPTHSGRTVRNLRDALKNIKSLQDANAFVQALQEQGHDVAGAAITFALQLDDQDPGKLVFSSTVHTAELTMPTEPRLTKAFESGKPNTVFKDRSEYTKEVLIKLAKNQMNIMCAVFGLDKKQVMQPEYDGPTEGRFRQLYADSVFEIFDIAQAYGIDLSVDQDGRSGFLRHCMKYHDDSVLQGGHKSSTVVDLEKGRQTESQFLIEALEELADEFTDDQRPNVHALRIMRRCMTSIRDAIDKGRDYRMKASELAENIVVLSDGRITQIRNTHSKAAVTQEGNVDGLLDPNGDRRSGTHFPVVDARAYRYGMIHKTAKYLVGKRAKDDLLDEAFLRALLEAYYDPEMEDDFAPGFSELETIIEEKITNFARMIDSFTTEKQARATTSINGNGGGGGTGRIQLAWDAEDPFNLANDLASEAEHHLTFDRFA